MKQFSALLFCLCLISGLQAQNLPSYLPANGLVGWWPFNGNANDESGNGNHGTVNGATLTADRFGNAGNAYGFDGVGNYIEVPDNSTLRPDKLSISVWYKTNNPDSFKCLVSKTTFSSAINEQYFFDLNDVGIKLNSSCNPNQGWSYFRPFGTAMLNLGEWTNLVFIWNGNSHQIFKNGELIQGQNWGGSAGQSGNIDNCSGGRLQFGRWWQLDPKWFDGKIDDIAIYNRALTQQEITQLYQAVNETSLSYQLSQEKLGNCNDSPVKLMVQTSVRLKTDSVVVNVNGEAATAYGNILNDGGKTITRRGFCWGTSAKPSLSNSFSENGSGIGIFNGTLSGLNANTNYYIRAYAGTATEVWYGNELMTSVGNTLHSCGTSGVHNAAKAYGTMSDQDGNSYKTIQIGDQEWMAENLKTAHYRNGEAIPFVRDSVAWNYQTTGAFTWFKNDSTAYNCPFGKLYNGFTTIDPRGLCPLDWHVPTKSEWEDFYSVNKNYISEGGPKNGFSVPSTNSSGFSALISGGRWSYYPNESYFDTGKGFIGGGPFFWASTDSNSYLGFLSFNNGGPGVHSYPKPTGFSVRCVKNFSETGIISGFECNSLSQSGSVLVQNLQAQEVQITIPYSGGNGGSYNELIFPSTGVLGLYAVLNPGKFNQGSGSLKLQIRGVPKTAGTANFILQVGGQSCNISLIVAANSLVVNCDAARIERHLLTGYSHPYDKLPTIVCKIPFSGSMDRVSIPSSQVKGLWANLSQSNPSDELSFVISGKPDKVGMAEFQIPIGQNCIFKVQVYDSTTDASCGYAAVHHPDINYFNSVSDQDGNVYRTIRIGSQLWMAENLRTSRYANGDIIPVINELNEWRDTTEGANCWYNKDSASNNCPYGRLYNHYAVQDARGLCPVGWHVPSEPDFYALFSEVTGVAQGDCAPYYPLISGLKSNELWESPNNCTSNLSGFSALPGGFRSALDGQDFSGQGQNTSWWLSGSSWNYGSFYLLNSLLEIGTENANQGRSVRCLKD